MSGFLCCFKQIYLLRPKVGFAVLSRSQDIKNLRFLQILSNVPQMFPYLGRFDSSPAALSIRGYEMLCPLYFRAVVEQSDLILRLD